MAHYGLLHDYRFEDIATAEDIRGTKVYGRNDEKLGTIDDVIFDHATGDIRFVVADAGGWFSSKKFLVPAHRLHTSAEHEDAFSVNLDKDQIQTLPTYNESDLRTQEHWESYEKRYSDAWHAGPVQHRHGSDHNITPTPQEMPPEPGSIGSQLSDEERARVNSRIVPPLSDEVTIQHNAVGLGDRWSNFEERLRQHRRRITKACTTCTVEPVSDRTSENAA
jgi:sporulation protein YlmC with PRC-barrel domain